MWGRRPPTKPALLGGVAGLENIVLNKDLVPKVALPLDKDLGDFLLVAARKVSQGEGLDRLLNERLQGDADPRELERVCKVAY